MTTPVGRNSPAPNSPPSTSSRQSSAEVNVSVSPPPYSSFVLPPPSPPLVGSGIVGKISSPPGSSNNTMLVALGVGVGIGGTGVLIAVAILFFWCRRRKRRLALSGPGPKDGHFDWALVVPPPTNIMTPMLPKPAPPPRISQLTSMGILGPHQAPTASSGGSPLSSPGVGLGLQVTFMYEELAIATDGFCEANLLGQGGFGYVHKGVLPNGRVVAVKQLKFGSIQGEREFQAEVEIISHVHHSHLVTLVGYCISGIQRLLVYEFVPNNTLEFHLHGHGNPPLSWSTRMRIAIGSAKGLAYLHDCQPKIIHRDIKAANILLDYDYEAKVADFGLARLNFDADTHVSTRVMGTFGYLAPEYALTGKLTDKSDVFSYGVMLLELITGRRPIDKTQYYVDDNIVDWARPLLTQALEDNNFETLADSRLQKDYDFSQMTRMVASAAACVRHLARRRPRMSQVVLALEGNISLDEINGGIKPGHSTIYGSYESSDYDAFQYKEDLKKFKKMALESQGQNSSEYSVTSDFGMLPSCSSSDGLQTTPQMPSSECSTIQIDETK